MFFDVLFNNIGKKLKLVGKFAWIALAALALLTGIFTIVDACSVNLFKNVDVFGVLKGIAIILIGPVVGFVVSLLLYGFGELIEKTTYNEYNTRCLLGNVSTNENNVAPQAAQPVMQPAVQQPVQAVQTQPTAAPVANTENAVQKTSHICTCGQRFYGDFCPYCGRGLNN